MTCSSFADGKYSKTPKIPLKKAIRWSKIKIKKKRILKLGLYAKNDYGR